MSGEVELIFLRRAEGGRFHFKTKPHARFDQLLAEMTRREGILGLRTVLFSPGSGYASIGHCYSISDDGMWVLRPHFTNYEAMLKKEHPPYEEQGQAHQEVRKCIHCGVALSASTVPCEYCHLPVCLLCRRTHVTTQHAEEILRGYTGSTYTYTWRVNPDMTAEGLEEIFRRFSASGPYARAARNAKSLTHETQSAFALLGTPHTSSAEEIRKAFKAKALVTHPDHGGQHEAMVKLNKARDVALAYAER